MVPIRPQSRSGSMSGLGERKFYIVAKRRRTRFEGTLFDARGWFDVRHPRGQVRRSTGGGNPPFPTASQKFALPRRRPWRELRHDNACRDGKQNPDTDNHHEKKPFFHWRKR
jgi:hypothetical protein